MLIVTAVHTFVAEHGDELEFQAGEKIVVLEKDDAFGDGWYRGRNAKGEEGLFPATYITEDSPTLEPAAAAQVKSSTPTQPLQTQSSPIESTQPQSLSLNRSRSPSRSPSLRPASTRSENIAPDEIPPVSPAFNGTINGSANTNGKSNNVPSDGFIATAAAGLGAAAVGVSTVMGKTIGEIEHAIDNINISPNPSAGATSGTTIPAAAKFDNSRGGDDLDNDSDQELGIGQNARARLAAQAQLANEARAKNRISTGVTGLVYSDESDDEEEEKRRSAKAASNGAVSATGAGATVVGLGSGFGTTNSNGNSNTIGHSTFSSAPHDALQPALPLPATPPLDKLSPTPTGSNTGSGTGPIPSKPPLSWNVDDVVEWAKAKGFDESIWSKFQEHEITGDLLLELDANLLKELDIPAFGKRLRIAQAISELRRPMSIVSASSQQMSPGFHTHSQSQSLSGSRGSAPPSAFAIPAPIRPSSTTPPASVTPPHSAEPTSATSAQSQPPSQSLYSAWAPSHSRKVSSASNSAMQVIRESDRAPAAFSSVPPSPVTPSSASAKRESGSSLGHKKGKPSLDNKERLSFFGRNRKPAPTTPGGDSSRSGSGTLRSFGSTKIHQMQPATPERSPVSATGPGANAGANTGAGAGALKQIGTPDHSGWMKKKGDRYGWKSRYFILKGAHLYYLKSEHEDKVKGHISLSGHRVIVDENTNPGSYGFRLVGSEKTHFFSSSEQGVIRGWMKALMKATIARDYSVAVTSSCNIPTVSLAEAQALAPRPPSPGTRERTQRATRRENTNTLTPHDASVLMSLDGGGNRISLTPSRPERDVRRPSAQFSRKSASSLHSPTTTTADIPSTTTTSPYAPKPIQDDAIPPLIDWVNATLPPQYPKATSFPDSFISGEVVFLLVRGISGIEPNPPVPPSAFSRDPDGLPGVDGLFAMMDMLIDSGIDTAGVSLNEVRGGNGTAIARLLESVKGWYETREG